MKHNLYKHWARSKVTYLLQTAMHVVSVYDIITLQFCSGIMLELLLQEHTSVYSQRSLSGGAL